VSYSAYVVALAPPWLRGKWGERWHEAEGLLLDMVAEGAVQAVKARLLGAGPDDALPYAGNDRQIERAPGESVESYRARLLGAFETWRRAGTNKGILVALAVIGYPTAAIYESHDWFPLDPAWWRFWLVLDPPSGFSSWKLGDGTKLGDKLVGLDKLGADAKAALTLLRRVVRKWKAAHTLCVKIIVVLSGKLIGTGWKLGDGTKLSTKSISVEL